MFNDVRRKASSNGENVDYEICFINESIHVYI